MLHKAKDVILPAIRYHRPPGSQPGIRLLSTRSENERQHARANRAIELNANYATAHHWYAEFLAFQGRFDEALAEIERARQLDPLSVIIVADNGAILYFARRYDQAIERFRAALAMEPALGRAHLIIAAYVQKGQLKHALADIENWRRTGDGPWTWSWEAHVYGRAGHRSKAQQALQKLKQGNRNWQGDLAPHLAISYLGMNEKERCLASLERAYQEHTTAVIGLEVDPVYDPLRGDPRFQDLLRRVGLYR